MQEIPNWIIKVIDHEKIKCKLCAKQFVADNLMSVGIQESSSPPHNDYLCIGLYCGECNELMIFELKEISLVEFAFEVLDQETSHKIKKRSKDDTSAYTQSKKKPEEKKIRKRKIKKSSITEKEVTEVRKFLKNKDLSHEEFLIALGMLPEEIKKYNYKK